MSFSGTNPPDESSDHSGLDATAELLKRVRDGDESAMGRLVEIYRPRLMHWAHGRLPANARGLVETEDLVQVSLLRVLDQLEGFEAKRPGAFLAYLRKTLLNQMRNEIRNATRRPRGAPITEGIAARQPSPLEQTIGREAIEAYEAALTQLPEEQQAAVILRIEFGCKHREIAETLGSPSVNAARMAVTRAVARLAENMGAWEGESFDG